MSHFRGGTQGRGRATAQLGTKSSGQSAWANTHFSRVEIDMRHRGRDGDDMDDMASITFSDGHGNGRKALQFNPNAVAMALATDDKKIQAIWDRVEREFNKLDDEAWAAIERVERRKKKEHKQRERQRLRREKEQEEILRTMQPEEKARIVKVMRYVELDDEGNFEDITWVTNINHGNIGIEEKSNHIFVHAPVGYEAQGPMFKFDVTKGIWEFPMDPWDLGITEEERLGFGYRKVRHA